MERWNPDDLFRHSNAAETLSFTYSEKHLADAKKRCLQAAEGFFTTFGTAPSALFSAPGRTELGGNHTDHQHGCVLAASVDLDLIAAAAPNDSGMIRIHSEGYPIVSVDIAELTPQQGEAGTPAALVRGVAAGFLKKGCSLQGCGMDAYITTHLPGGRGLSSSAAFEVLMALMMDHLFFGAVHSKEELAMIGQFAENEYFGKPCGLMDQMACALGGAVAIDFKDPTSPKYECIPLDLSSFGYALCIIDSGAGHADLTNEYAAITDELRMVSAFFGKSYLREVAESDFFAQLPALRKRVGDRAVLRAMHVFCENRRAQEEALALKEGDFPRFLALIRESGKSSTEYLQNITPAGQTARQELLFALALCEHILSGDGAVRVHGGGFGGTAQAFVPLAKASGFQDQVEAVLGAGSCQILGIRPAGGIRLI